MVKKFLKIGLLCIVVLLAFMIYKNTVKNNNKTENPEVTKVGFQLEFPKKDEEIAVFDTNAGSFKVRLFDKEAPKATKNFKELVTEKHYYEGLIFHRVISNFMIQSGDPNGNGTGGESIYGKPFEDEFNQNLFNITGALSMANSGPNTNSSQFFINYQHPDKFVGWENIKNSKKINMKKITNEIKNLYTKNGGNPTLDGYYSTSGHGHTVFGQVFEGIDIINKISLVETDSNNKPLKPVIIKKITIEKA